MTPPAPLTGYALVDSDFLEYIGSLRVDAVEFLCGHEPYVAIGSEDYALSVGLFDGLDVGVRGCVNYVEALALLYNEGIFACGNDVAHLIGIEVGASADTGDVGSIEDVCVTLSTAYAHAGVVCQVEFVGTYAASGTSVTADFVESGDFLEGLGVSNYDAAAPAEVPRRSPPSRGCLDITTRRSAYTVANCEVAPKAWKGFSRS